GIRLAGGRFVFAAVRFLAGFALAVLAGERFAALAVLGAGVAPGLVAAGRLSLAGRATREPRWAIGLVRALRGGGFSGQVRRLAGELVLDRHLDRRIARAGGGDDVARRVGGLDVVAEIAGRASDLGTRDLGAVAVLHLAKLDGLPVGRAERLVAGDDLHGVHAIGQLDVHRHRGQHRLFGGR